jgi:hypothetical protein
MSRFAAHLRGDRVQARRERRAVGAVARTSGGRQTADAADLTVASMDEPVASVVGATPSPCLKIGFALALP